jgi:hypothetical protein
MSEAGVRKSYVDTSGGQIHVRSMAGEGIPVVFFHQTASSGQMWLKTMQLLKGQCRCTRSIRPASAVRSMCPKITIPR